MNPAILAALLVNYGPAAIKIAIKLFEDFEAGRTQTSVTLDDLKELQRLSSLTSVDIFRREGVEPPVAPAA